MNKEKIITEVAKQIQQQFANESTGHDWFHIERVWKTAKHIGKKEGGDLFIIELAALLHDIADHKFVENAEKIAKEKINKMLGDLNVKPTEIEKIIQIVNNTSFKGGFGNSKTNDIEGLIVKDADRLDAIGAIGIARTFAFGGKFGNLIYNPEIKPTKFQSAEEYKKNRTHTINHFYEKLLLLKDQMNTKTAKKMAEKKHHFMEIFLTQFYAEWNCEI